MDISLVIPVYNVEKYLEKCLNSIIEQSLDIKYEIICVNDGSTDNSLAILEAYKQKYDNIKIINQKNKGLSAARNVGLRESTGNYIMFIDSDDYLIGKHALNELYEEVSKNNLDFIVADFTYTFDDLSKNYEIKRSDSIKNKIMTGKEMFDLGIRSKSIMSVVWNKMYNREFLVKNNLSFIEGIVYEDVEFTPKAYYLAKRVKFLNKSVYAYRQRENSIMSSKNQVRIDDYIVILDSLSDFNKKYNSNTLTLQNHYISKCIVNDLKNINENDKRIEYIEKIKKNKNFLVISNIYNIKYTIFIKYELFKMKFKTII